MTKKILLKVLRVLGGTICLAVGVLGGFIPVFQGWVFVALGCVLLSVDVPLFRKLVLRAEKRFPRLKQHIGAWKKKFGTKDQDGLE